MTADTILHHLLSASCKPESMDSLQAWWRAHGVAAARFEEPIDVALAAGLSADRLGYAFASGYQCAGRAMFGPQLGDRNGMAALCATESGGAHPRAIETQLSRDQGGQLRLDGAKAFVTLGQAAELLLVVASEGVDEAGRNRLRVVAVDASRQGVQIRAIDTVAFVPEIPHGSVTFRSVAVADHELLEGDGYTRYLKPFRTVEDCFVHAGLLGWLMRIARTSEWPSDSQEAIVAQVVTIRGLALADPSSPATHIALAGALTQSELLIERLEPNWQSVDVEHKQRWERDRMLLEVAGRARSARRQAAWRRITDGAER